VRLIYTIDQVFADPQVQHLQMARTVHHPELGDIAIVEQAIPLSRTTAELKTATAGLGEHTDQVLAELARTPDEIAKLHAEGVVL